MRRCTRHLYARIVLLMLGAECSRLQADVTTATGPGCFGYSLGARTKSTPTAESSTILRRTFGFHNTGYAFHRYVWDLIQRYDSQFWAGTYGWDWSVWRLMQQQKKHTDNWFPRMMLYPKLSRVHNAGIRGGVTVNDAGKEDGSPSLSTWLISGVYELAQILVAALSLPCSCRYTCSLACHIVQLP